MVRCDQCGEQIKIYPRVSEPRPNSKVAPTFSLDLAEWKAHMRTHGLTTAA
jgi:hypothetical protein